MRSKIILAKSAGLCFGVKRAIAMASRAARKYSEIEMLGDIVHNEDVCRDIYRSGIKKVKGLKKNKGKVLLISAHGTTIKVLKKAKKLGYKVIDATCPMVKEIHKIAKSMENKCRRIILIGDKDHAEVKGIVGHLKLKPLIIENQNDFPTQKLKKIKKACGVVQSTQNVEKVDKISKRLKSYIKDLKFFNTICVPTRNKQAEVRSLPLKNDIMIIIGSKTSANTQRLYEISKSLNKKTYWVQSAQDLKKAWFKGVVKIGVTAGASTPDQLIKIIIRRIKELTK